jgi:HSP20 family protein
MTGRKRDIDDLAGEIQELFADMWQVPRFSAGLRQGYRPQADCYRTDDPPALHVVVELPGVDPATLNLVAQERTLAISGERQRPRVAGAVYQQMEIEYGPFQRKVRLSEDVDPQGASAEYDRGVLTVRLPIAAKPRPPSARFTITVVRQ